MLEQLRARNGTLPVAVEKSEDAGLATNQSPASTVCFWNLESGELIKKNRNKFFPVDFSADGTRARTRGTKGYVEWDVATGKKLRTIEIEEPAKAIRTRVTPDSRWVITETAVTFGRVHGEILSARERTGEELGHFGAFYERNWALPGSRVVTRRDACDDDDREVAGELRVYELEPLRIAAAARVERPVGHKGYRTKEGKFGLFTTSRDGSLIIVGDSDARIYAFEAPKPS